MKKVLILGTLLIATACLLIWKIYNGLLRPAAKDATAAIVQTPFPGRAVPPPSAKTQETPKVGMRTRQELRREPRFITETFLSAENFRDGDAYVRTDQAFYRVGELSIHGMVKAIRWPDEGKLFAVITVMSVEDGTEFIVAQNTPRERTRLQNVESAAISGGNENNDNPHRPNGAPQTGSSR